MITRHKIMESEPLKNALSVDVVKMFTNELQGHLSDIFHLDILRNGNLVSASKDTTMKIWDKNTFNCIRTLEGHTDCVQSLVTCYNGDIISVSNDRTIKIWNSDTGALKRTINTAHNGWITCIKLYINKDEIVTGSRDETIKLWNYKTGECKVTIRDFRSFDGCKQIFWKIFRGNFLFNNLLIRYS